MILPTLYIPDVLGNKFANFFDKKVEKIRQLSLVTATTIMMIMCIGMLLLKMSCTTSGSLEN